MFEQLAEELRTARERAQFTQESLAAAIKMDFRFLQRMEKGDFTFLPELYVRAFIKDYSRTVGLDEMLIIRQFENLKSGRALNDHVDEDALRLPDEHSVQSVPVQTPARVFIDGVSADDVEEKPRFKLTDTQKNYILAGGLSLIIVGMLVYFLFFNDDSPKVVMENQPIEEILAEQKRYEEPVEQTQPAVQDSINLRIEVKDSCWVAMTTDSIFTKSRRYAPGAVIEQKAASNIKLSLGNASKVLMFVSGQPFDLTQYRYHTTSFLVTRDSVQELK